MARVTLPPNTKTATTHAITIQVDGILIGAINGWSPTQNMQATPVYEFGAVTGPYGDEFGTPYETVPGNVTGLTVGIQRYDIFTQPMERVFGAVDLNMLSANVGRATAGTGVFDVEERWTTPDGVGNYRVQYRGCWLTQIGRNMTTQSDRIVQVNAQMAYTNKRRREG